MNQPWRSGPCSREWKNSSAVNCGTGITRLSGFAQHSLPALLAKFFAFSSRLLIVIDCIRSSSGSIKWGRCWPIVAVPVRGGAPQLFAIAGSKERRRSLIVTEAVSAQHKHKPLFLLILFFPRKANPQAHPRVFNKSLWSIY